MQLSVCLMVRDEEANLPRALDSVREVADEILVIDTGSVDKTVSIAKSRGARVLHCDWHDDFSAPHNFGWEHARGDWLLWLDGDESLLPCSIPHLRACVNRSDVGAFYIQRQEIVDNAEPDWFTEMVMLRLHRRDLPTRFVGRYHTQIVLPPADAPPVNQWAAGWSEVKLQHWRFKADNLLRARRAARILEGELKDEPDNLYVMIELSQSLREIGDPRADEFRRRAVAMLDPTAARPPTIPVVYLLDHLIANPADGVEVNLSFADLRAICTRWFPRSAPLKWAIAQRSFADQDYESAAIELAEVVELVKGSSLDKLVPFDPRIREDAEFNLGVCLTRLARLDEAEALFNRILDNPKRSNGARANLEVIAQLRKLEES